MAVFMAALTSVTPAAAVPNIPGTALPAKPPAKVAPPLPDIIGMHRLVDLKEELQKIAQITSLDGQITEFLRVFDVYFPTRRICARLMGPFWGDFSPDYQLKVIELVPIYIFTERRDQLYEWAAKATITGARSEPDGGFVVLSQLRQTRDGAEHLIVVGWLLEPGPVPAVNDVQVQGVSMVRSAADGMRRIYINTGRDPDKFVRVLRQLIRDGLEKLIERVPREDAPDSIPSMQ